MTRVWSKQDGDLKILEALYKHKYLRGKTLTLISGFGEKKGYDRISAMKRQGLISGETVVRQVEVGKRIINKKVAAIYYLTTKGTLVVKDIILKEVITGEERGRRPTEDDKNRAYQVSLILEGLFDMYDSFSPPAEYKTQQEIPNFVPIDLVCGNNIIFIDKHNGAGKNMHQKILLRCQSLQDRFNKKVNSIILSSNDRNRNSLVKFNAEHYGQEERIVLQSDFISLRYLLNPGQNFRNYFLNTEADIEDLKTPQDGCSYIINGEPANIFDIVGMPPRTLRRVKRASGKIYLGLSNYQEIRTLEKYYPEVARQDNVELLVLKALLQADPNILSAPGANNTDKWAQVIKKGYME